MPDRSTMRAAWIEEHGPSDVLRVGDRPLPEPRSHEVTIDVHAASINPRDWMIRAGSYPFRFMLPKLPVVLGSDVAGTIAEVGSEVTGFTVGDPVFAMVPSSDGFGGYAEVATVRATAVVRKPETMSFEEAAGVPLAALTALQALRDDARMQPGQAVVIVGASGGVGHYGIQIARALGASEVIGVCSERNLDLVRELGCDRAIDYRAERFQDVIEHADVVFDAVGRHHLGGVVPPLGRGGAYVTTVPSGRQMVDSLRTRLWPFGRRSRIVLVSSRGDDLRWLADLAEAGRFRSVIDRVEPLEQVAALHDHSRTFRSRGKNILRIR
ncbi:MAG: NAD(P)-dependent alcohol dehydrogenase [Acidobacteriota bacterium]